MDREKLNNYLKILRSTFYIDAETIICQYPMALKPYLVEGINARNGNIDNWNDFIKFVKINSNARVRNMDNAGQIHSYTGIFSYDSNSKGIIFCISFPFKLYGFYYAKLEEYDKNKIIERLDYFPFDEEMKNYKTWIKNAIQKYFPFLEEFDNFYAKHKIEKIIIGAFDKHQNLDLYRAIFSTNEHGIL